VRWLLGSLPLTGSRPSRPPFAAASRAGGTVGLPGTAERGVKECSHQAILCLDPAAVVGEDDRRYIFPFGAADNARAIAVGVQEREPSSQLLQGSPGWNNHRSRSLCLWPQAFAVHGRPVAASLCSGLFFHFWESPVGRAGLWGVPDGADACGKKPSGTQGG